MSQQTATMFSKQTFVKGCYFVLNSFVACIWKHQGCDWPKWNHNYSYISSVGSMVFLMNLYDCVLQKLIAHLPVQGIPENLSLLKFCQMYTPNVPKSTTWFQPTHAFCSFQQDGMFKIQCITLNRATWQNSFLVKPSSCGNVNQN